MTSVKSFMSYSKVLLFWKISSCLVCVSSFKSINGSSLSREKNDGGNFTPTPRRLLRDQNTSMEIELIKLSEPSGTFHFLNIAFYELFYRYFYCLYSCGTKSFILKTELYFIFGWVKFGVRVLEVLCFWCSF